MFLVCERIGVSSIVGKNKSFAWFSNVKKINGWKFTVSFIEKNTPICIRWIIEGVTVCWK